MPEPGGCRRCTVGVPLTIAVDENGSTVRCLNCEAQWTEPADADAQAAQVEGLDENTARGDIAELAHARGIDPTKFRTVDALIDEIAKADRSKSRSRSEAKA